MGKKESITSGPKQVKIWGLLKNFTQFIYSLSKHKAVEAHKLEEQPYIPTKGQASANELMLDLFIITPSSELFGHPVAPL